MGFRYRKSIKIAPGVKVNLGKKSTSVSFGVKGARRTISTTGRKTTSVGIPGTGLYYTTSSSLKNSGASANKNRQYTPDNTSESEDAYKAVEDFNNSIEYLTSLYKTCDYNYNWKAIYNEAPPFKWGEIGPNELKAIGALENYKPGILEKTFKSRLENKLQKLEKDISISKEKDKSLYSTWEEQHKLAALVLKEDIDSLIKVLKDVQFSSMLNDFVDSFDFEISEEGVFTISYHLNIEEIVPQKYLSLTPTGRLSVKNYTKTAYYELLRLYVSGFALRIARNIFGLLPLKTIIINTNTFVVNTEIGRQEDIIILSALINKEDLEKLNFELIDPYDALNNFKVNVKFLKTKGFQPIEKISL